MVTMERRRPRQRGKRAKTRSKESFKDNEKARTLKKQIKRIKQENAKLRQAASGTEFDVESFISNMSSLFQEHQANELNEYNAIFSNMNMDL